KLANVAHNLQKKEDELSDQLAAYGRLEGSSKTFFSDGFVDFC
ncbi:hypothetical protein A4X06_0g9345, partial [Tilletia controversa]